MKKSKLTTEERVLKHLLTKYQDSKTNVVTFSRSDLSKLNITEPEATRSLCLLQEDTLLKINTPSQNKDLSRYWEIALKSDGIHYFENLKQQKEKRFENSFRYWVTTGLAVIAIIISIIALNF